MGLILVRSLNYAFLLVWLKYLCLHFSTENTVNPSTELAVTSGHRAVSCVFLSVRLDKHVQAVS